MGIQNFPASLQPIIQQGFLEREFQQALTSRLGYRAVADREEFAVGIGETLTKTRAGLRPSITTPLAPSTNTNLDNGLTPGTWGVEQYTLTLYNYASTMDLNVVTSRVGIASQFLQNAYVNGEQAARSLDDLARNALFNAYFGGNSWVRVTIANAGPSVSVDDVRGFQTAFVNGVQQPVSTSNPLAITVGLLFFFWELIKYIRAPAEEKTKARSGILYSILALFIMISIVGILRLLQTVTGTQGVNVIDSNSIPTVQF